LRNLNAIISLERDNFNISKDSDGNFIEIDPNYFQNLFKGKFNNTPVSIKKYNSKNVAKLFEFKDKVLEDNNRSRHPNIFLLMAFNVHKNSLNLIYEFYEFVNLHVLYLDKEEFPEITFNMDFKKKIATQLLFAIIYLHNLNPPIYHNAIRPNNLLINKLDCSLKLADFEVGIGDSPVNDKLFYLKNVLQYSSPKQVYLKPTLFDNMWSFGCTIFYLTTEEDLWLTNVLESHEANIMAIKRKMNDEQLPENIILYSTSIDSFISFCITYDVDSQYTAEKVYSLLVE